MRINKITATNFRTLEDIEVNFESYYSTISGHNNAGKSCLVRLIRNLLGNERSLWIYQGGSAFSYRSDYTHWRSEESSIEIEYFITLNREDDSGLLVFVERFLSKKVEGDLIEIQISYSLRSDGSDAWTVIVSGGDTDSEFSREFINKLRTANTLLIHNSTEELRDRYFGGGRFVSTYEVHMTNEERDKLAQSEKTFQNKIKRLAKNHKDDINAMLGRLSEKYDVVFSALDHHGADHLHLGVNLKDRNVEVPLPDWGSGTQNRTKILMSMLKAIRTKQETKLEDKVTPIVVLEEPESFLHPAAQAEFGRILSDLSSEIGVQTIVATHSPYMLNQSEPIANLLLRRKISRGIPKHTEVIVANGDDWMCPFAEHLGIVPPEFEDWRVIFGSQSQKVLLVEGEIDKEYLEYLREAYGNIFPLPKEVEILSYGGTGALRNTKMLSFVCARIGRCVLTFDLDAKEEIQKSLEGIGLVEGKDFLAIGLPSAGKRNVEGLLPNSVIKAVSSSNTDLMLEIANATGKEAKSPRNRFKSLLLAEFKQAKDIEAKELAKFANLGKSLAKMFN